MALPHLASSSLLLKQQNLFLSCFAKVSEAEGIFHFCISRFNLIYSHLNLLHAMQCGQRNFHPKKKFHKKLLVVLCIAVCCVVKSTELSPDALLCFYNGILWLSHHICSSLSDQLYHQNLAICHSLGDNLGAKICNTWPSWWQTLLWNMLTVCIWRKAGVSLSLLKTARNSVVFHFRIRWLLTVSFYFLMLNHICFICVHSS